MARYTDDFIEKNFNLDKIFKDYTVKSEQTLFDIGLALHENMRLFVPKHTRELMRSIKYPIKKGDALNSHIQIRVAKEYAAYQDEKELRHRPGYDAMSRQQSSFAKVADITLRERTQEVEKRIDELPPETKAYENANKHLKSLREASKDVYNYHRGYVRELGHGFKPPVQGVITEATNYVEKAFEAIEDQLPDLLNALE